MSILINGMSLPKDGCKSCGFDIYGSCLIKANLDKPWGVARGCPLVELPPHGRLGDLDALIDEAYQPGAYGYVDAIQIENAPTIIPAEGGVDNG